MVPSGLMLLRRGHEAVPLPLLASRGALRAVGPDDAAAHGSSGDQKQHDGRLAAAQTQMSDTPSRIFSWIVAADCDGRTELPPESSARDGVGAGWAPAESLGPREARGEAGAGAASAGAAAAAAAAGSAAGESSSQARPSF